MHWSLSRVWLFVTPWTVARQASLSVGFSRQEYWSGQPFPSPGGSSQPGNEPRSLAGGFYYYYYFFLPSDHQGSPYWFANGYLCCCCFFFSPWSLRGTWTLIYLRQHGTCNPCTGKRNLNHRATREALWRATSSYVHQRELLGTLLWGY